MELFTGIKTINQSAFKGSSIKSVRLSNNVTKIDSSAFYQSSLESINIPPSVTSLGWGTFRECKSLVMEELYLPNLTGNLDGGQFGYGAQIRKVTSLGSITSMQETFNSNKLLEMCILPETLTKLLGGVFSGCSNLRTLVLKQENITHLSSGVFLNCTNLQIEIDLPNLSTLDKYGESCFSNSGITKVLNLGATSIYQNNMFYNCKNLTYVNLPSTTTTIGYNVFNGCSNLETLIVNATTPPTLGYATFLGCEKMTIYVPDDSVDAYKAATGWVGYASRIKGISELQ